MTLQQLRKEAKKLGAAIQYVPTYVISWEVDKALQIVSGQPSSRSRTCDDLVQVKQLLAWLKKERKLWAG